MFGSTMALPFVMVRAVAELVLLVVALTVVIRAHRNAGLALATGASLALFTSVVVPVVEIASLVSFSWIGQSGGGLDDGGYLLMFVIVAVAWLPYIGQTLTLGLVIWAVVMLAGGIPEDQRPHAQRYQE